MPLSSLQFRGKNPHVQFDNCAARAQLFFPGKQTRPVSRGKSHGLSGTRDSPAVRFSTKKNSMSAPGACDFHPKGPSGAKDGRHFDGRSFTAILKFEADEGV